MPDPRYPGMTWGQTGEHTYDLKPRCKVCGEILESVDCKRSETDCPEKIKGNYHLDSARWPSYI
jgi:hypothetical protein